MQVTLDIPDETAKRMFGESTDPTVALLELAGYIACVNGRISEYEFMKLLGLESRFDLHAVMKRLQSEAEEQDLEFIRQDLSTLAKLDESHQSSKSG